MGHATSGFAGGPGSHILRSGDSYDLATRRKE